MKKPLFFLFVVISSLTLSANAGAQYFVLLTDGQKLGWASENRTVTAGQVEYTMQMNMTFNRSGTEMTVFTQTETVETRAGKPVSFEHIEKINGMGRHVKGAVTADGKMSLETEMMGVKQNSTVDYPQNALMTEAARKAMLAKGLKPGTKGSILAFEPSVQQAVKTSWIVRDRSFVQLLDTEKQLIRVDVTAEMPSGSLEIKTWIDEKGFTHKMKMPMMGMSFEMIAADEKIAKGRTESLTVDLFDKMMLNSPVTLDDQVLQLPLVYHLKIKEGSMPVIPSDSNQRAAYTTDGMIILRVSPVRSSSGMKIPYSGDDPQLLEALKPASYIQSDHPSIRSLANKAVGDTDNALTAVLKIEQFTHDYIVEKNLSVGYAGAAEVARTRKGDCSEHAILAAALCRAAGIPARVVTGIVYAPYYNGEFNVFGGHAWTEAWLGDKWYPIDATRPARGGFGSGHIALARGNGDPENFFSLVNTLGYFTIEKIEVLKNPGQDARGAKVN